MSNFPSMDEYMSFVNQYHADTVRAKKAARTPDGRIMTVNAKGVEHKGMIYTVPGYDRETGIELSDKQAYETYLPDILAGRVKGLPAGKAGVDPKSGVHLANVYARKNHKNVKADRGAVAFDFYKPSLSDAPR